MLGREALGIVESVGVIKELIKDTLGVAIGATFSDVAEGGSVVVNVIAKNALSVKVKDVAKVLELDGSDGSTLVKSKSYRLPPQKLQNISRSKDEPIEE